MMKGHSPPLLGEKTISVSLKPSSGCRNGEAENHKKTAIFISFQPKKRHIPSIISFFPANFLQKQLLYLQLAR